MSLNVYLFLACLGTVEVVYGDELCEKPADIAFVIDSSGSISEDNFKLQLQFVQELVNTFDIGPDKIHVAALKFSRDVVKEFYFNDVTSTKEASERIGKITHSSGDDTLTHNALEAMRKDLFSPSNGARADVAKICVLLTDGNSAQPTETFEQARLAKIAGITIVAVGIGAANTEELEKVVSPPASENYVYASSFSKLKDKLKAVGKQACEVITTTPAPPNPGDKSNESDELCEKPADIAFVIDSSGSISEDNFKLQLQFVQELVNTFDIGPDKIHVAALKFSRDVVKEFYFNDVTSTKEASERIGKITHSSGDDTLTHNALEAMRKDLFSPSNGARADVAKICVLLTDGNSAQPTETFEQARLAKIAGITIVAVGIGAANTEELEKVVSPPASEYYVYASSFSKLKDKLKAVGKQACEVITTTPAPPACHRKNADILFVVDMSSSIWSVDFIEQLNFLADFVSNFDIDNGKTRVGMLTFSNSTEVSFFFNQYSRKTDIIQAIRQVKQEGGLTNTHLALQETERKMFTERFGSRREVAHICIVITDGESRYPAKTTTAAALLRRLGVEVFAIGVGNQVNVQELRSIASRPEFVFEVKGYGALRDIKNMLAVKSCEDTKPPVPTDPKDECQYVKKDIVFAVDMSNSIWSVHFKEQLQFISDLISYFDIDNGDTRVGMLTYSTGPKVQFYLNTYGNKESLKKAILSVKTEGGSTNTHLALQTIREEMLRKENGQRPEVEQVCIVITDGVSRQPKQTSYQADLLHDSGVDVIAIGVGDDIDYTELSEIASKHELMFKADGPSKLKTIKEIIAAITCKTAKRP